MTTYVFKAELQEEEDGRWSAWIDALPGCATWGYTREEALQALQDGTELFVECMLEYGNPIPVVEIEGDGEPTVRVTVYVFKATLQEEEDGRWSSWIDELPGAAGWGYTRKEALEVLQDIAELCVEEMLEWGEPIPSEEIEYIGESTIVVAA